MKSLVDRAVNLFTFLAKREAMKTTVIRDLSAYEKEGSVRWLSALPESVTVSPDAEDQDHVLTVSRPPALPAPRTNEEIQTWLTGPLDDPKRRPAVSPPVTSASGSEDEDLDAQVEPTEDEVATPPEVLTWLEHWDRWSEEHVRTEAQKKLYREFFQLHDRSTQESDTSELVLGLGLLSWDVLNTEGRAQGRIDRIRRHLLTVPVQASMEQSTGDIRIDLDESRLGLNAEVDMIPASEIADQAVVRELVETARGFDGGVMDREAVSSLLMDFIHRFHAEGEWTDANTAPLSGPTPVVSWSPALILRQRRRAGLAQALQTIAERISEDQQVPAGVAPLLDPDQLPPVERDATPGAVITLDDEVFSPLPLNDVQRRIIEHVDSHAQTLVQGPPGTGKTHTAAALISHLLAQGKRILITAETERALVEIRGKLPEQVKPLAVSVVGTGREEMAELRTAVDTIADKSTSHDREAALRRINALHQDIDRLRLERASLSASLVAAREVDVAVHRRGHYEGTLARIAERYREEEDRHGWITDVVPASVDLACPLSTEELAALQRNMSEAALPSDLDGLQGRRPDLAAVMTPEEFSDRVHQLSGMEEGGQEGLDPVVRSRAAALSSSSVEKLDSLRRTALALTESLSPLSGSREAWVADAVADVMSEHDAPWQGVRASVAGMHEALDGHLLRLGDTAVQVHADPARMVILARRLLQELGPEGRLKTAADGSVKVGMFTPTVVKESRELFDAVRVDGVAPSTGAHFAAILENHQVHAVLAQLDQVWRVDPQTSASAHPRARRDAHHSRVQLLDRVLGLAAAAHTAAAELRAVGGVPVHWVDPAERRVHLDSLLHARREAVARDAIRPVQSLESHVSTLAQWKDAAAPVHELLDALRERDVNRYRDAYALLVRLKAHADAAAERDVLLARLRPEAPRLADKLRGPDPEGVWTDRVPTLRAAFDWLALGPWVAARENVDVNQVQDQIKLNDEALRTLAEELASLRAWNHAVSPERLTPSSRADLRGYSQLVRRLGKGTGKYADRRRGQIREAMERCRPAVPVWIMPLYRVTEQFSMEERMFDVVIVDEASQAGAEAVFLQYLAPKIVVIGDDKQVTPSAVGTKLDDLQQLAGRYLEDHPSRPYWEDPQRSLFDEALQRYGGQLTLTEHRRCVPEIIEFSNQIAYRPDNVELVPVRQFGADRLEPFVITHVADGREEGSSSRRVNRAEARALVDDLRACLADPAFEGRSMAVISLGGPTQVSLIETLVMEEIPAEDLARHNVRVGLPPSFQGSERDVIFLSLVTGPSDEGKRIMAQTSDQYVQRFNVAVSRAKDQIRLFHTATLNDFKNSADLRYRLLDYAYGVARRGRALAPGESPFVSDAVRQAPFDSLFEQRIYNRIVARGFTVEPQFQAIGYSLDLVVIGPKSRVAVECDGDHWHGPEQYKDDLRRQRELERCGWTVFRVRESLYYVDPEKALEPLWQLLEEMKIRPSGWLEEDEVADEVLADGSAPSDDAASEEDVELEGEHPDRPLDDPTPDDDPSPDVGDTEDVLEFSRPSVGVEVHDDFTGLTSSPDAVRVPAIPPAARASQDDFPTAVVPAVKPYEAFTGRTVPVHEAERAEIHEGILAILEVEGPAIGDRVKRVYVEASGLRRMGHVIERGLDAALRSVVHRALVVAEDPLDQRKIGGTTYRLPAQPDVVPRDAGPREIRVIPPAEVAAQMARIRKDQPQLSKDELLRATLEHYGQKRLTEQIRAHLNAVHALMDSMSGGTR